MIFPGNARIRPITAFVLCMLALAPFALGAAESDRLPVERYALYVASNDGGPTRETLKYAGTDAERLAKTMNDIGGVKPQNSLILIDPSKAEIDKAFADFRRTIGNDGEKAKRTEFLFYYSGHSDEKSFLLGKESYAYAALKTMLNTVPTDVHVVMLDSCYSGNFVRAKGGSREKPFLMDDSSVVQGHAYLSSSSEDEASQESDSIKASYFTQALVTGLRGAADASGDGKVSLNELYYYAFNDTLSQTELSTVGPQHPAYNITLVGSGDLVLTDTSESESILYIPKEYQGNYFIRNSEGDLVSEINKTQGTELALALPAGIYSITLVTPTVTMQGSVALAKGHKLALDSSIFTGINRTYGRSRGDAQEAEDPPAAEEKWIPFGISFVPGMTMLATETDNVNVSLGIFLAQNKNISGAQLTTFGGFIPGNLSGAQAAGFMNSVSGEVTGVQLAGFMNTSTTKTLFTGVQSAGFLNTASGPLKGVQSSGFLNTAANGFTGLQAAGFLNIAGKSSTGAQLAGFINIADEIKGTQIGVINIAKKGSGAPIGIVNVILDGIISPGVFADTNGNFFVQYQGGNDRFFTTLMTGAEMERGIDQEYLICGFGIGTRLKIVPKLSVDLELITKQIVTFDTPEHTQDVDQIPSVRTTVNYFFAKHLGIFASLNIDCRVPGYNDEAFGFGHRQWSQSFANDRFALYPSMSYGLKF